MVVVVVVMARDSREWAWAAEDLGALAGVIQGSALGKSWESGKWKQGTWKGRTFHSPTPPQRLAIACIAARVPSMSIFAGHGSYSG